MAVGCSRALQLGGCKGTLGITGACLCFVPSCADRASCTPNQAGAKVLFHRPKVVPVSRGWPRQDATLSSGICREDRLEYGEPNHEAPPRRLSSNAAVRDFGNVEGRPQQW